MQMMMSNNRTRASAAPTTPAMMDVAWLEGEERKKEPKAEVADTSSSIGPAVPAKAGGATVLCQLSSAETFLGAGKEGRMGQKWVGREVCQPGEGSGVGVQPSILDC